MPFVKLHYGPYVAHGIIKYRIQRLHGLIRCLSEKQYEIEIIPSVHLNRLTIEMGDSVIFQCDIRNLLFNMECEKDPVCQRAVESIDEAASRIYAESNIPTFVSIKEGKRYLEKCKYLTIKDYFSSSIELLYEHQQHLRADKRYTYVDKGDDKQLLDSHAGLGEDDYYVYDEYADWDYASGIIRNILNQIISKESMDVTTTDDDYSTLDKTLGYKVLDNAENLFKI